MNTSEVIHKRCSVRNYSNEQVDRRTIGKLLDAAAHAPSAMNSQPWVFAVIQGSEKLKTISDDAKECLLDSITPKSPLMRYRDTLRSKDFNIFYNASTLVLICAKPNASPSPETDCALAAENLMLMAAELELGTCWIGFAKMYLNTTEGKLNLGIPVDHAVIAPIIVGYPLGDPKQGEKKPAELLFWK